ncbi:NAD(P)-dependent oxidoreductase [Propionivibrio sp.]|uniref:NAD-dependent epimerase/dehydratase family protein n=1 Tax=Propionivibrio sp. TaxID=2212460 RepID=UPI0025D13B5D|nr:NAD-dependent epimerase/dehydratase family protein [Propionivibrio sp.]
MGRALCQRLQSDGVSLLGVDRSDGDVAESRTWDALPPAKVVIHLAGRSYVPDSWKDSAGFLQSNMLGTENALAYCRRHGARIVYISAYVYGAPELLPISESHPARPNNPYALSKYLAEQLCNFAYTYQEVQASVLRLFNVFGPGQRAEFLIPAIVEQVLAGKEIRILDLHPRRDYVYLDDVVDAIIKAAAISKGFHVFNIGSGVSLSVSEVIEQIQGAADTNLPVTSSARERPQEIPDVRADITQARQILGWEPRWSFLRGVQQLLCVEKLCD